MADFQFYEADSDDSCDSGDDGLLTSTEGYDSDTSNPDYGLGPLQKLEKHMLSEHSYTRQVVAKNLLETLKAVDNHTEAEKVLQAMVKLASDLDSAVRTEVMEQVYAISQYVQAQQVFDRIAVSLYIVPTLVKCLQDCNAQVRKTSQSSMIAVIQEGIVSCGDVETSVMPVILELAEPDGLDDFRAEAIVMMTKLAPLLGADVTTRSFLDRFLDMCNDSLFHVRKVCATNFGEMCHVVGCSLTEAKLLPKFASLCEDDVWGVRNACTECFMQVSQACSMPIRRGELSRLFVGLLSDQSRWVRLAAFQSLGAFISTFADPDYTGLSLSEDGKIIQHKTNTECKAASYKESDQSDPSCRKDASFSAGLAPNDELIHSTKVKIGDEIDDTEFTSFNYWRTPIIEVSQDTKGTSPEKPMAEVVADSNDQNCALADVAETSVLSSFSDPTFHCKTECLDDPEDSDHKNENKSHRDCPEKDESSCRNDVSLFSPSMMQLLGEMPKEYDDALCLEPTFEDPQQFAIPPELLHHYLSMVDTNNAQTVDAEIMKHCAFSFPAVAFALGRRNWYLLKSAYDRLAKDLQWKVRRTLSSSIHEMAVILGEELTATDLLPIFDDFLKDLDEVRIGVLKHLTDFLKLLKHDVRRQYLPRIADFLSTDNSRNWRFRLDLTEQLIELLDLFSPTDIVEHLSSIALALADDKVAQIRYMSLHVLSKIIKKLSLDVCAQLWSDFVDCTKSKLYQSDHYGRRQLFAHLCSNLIESHSVSKECFAKTFLPCVIALSQDRVPNVRLAVANCVFKHLVHDEYFTKSKNPLQESFHGIVEALLKDPDNDIQWILRTHAPHLLPASETSAAFESTDMSTNLSTSYSNEYISKCDEKTDKNIGNISVPQTDVFLSMEH